MGTLNENTSNIRALLDDISALPPNQYEEGYNQGYSDGEASRDVLSGIECESVSSYYGKRLDSFGDQKLIALFTLKKGKTVPSGSFGHIRNSGNVTAGWVASSGTISSARTYQVFTPSTYTWSIIGCYPPDKETWDAFMDAFDVRVELIDTEL